MEEDSTKCSDTEAEDNSSPRKKVKTEDDLQQPSTSGTGASTSSGNIASTSTAVTDESAGPTERANNPEPEPHDDAPERAVEEGDDALLGGAAAAAGNSPRPPRARSSSGDRRQAEDDEARSDDVFMQNLERSVERLRRNVHRLANRRNRVVIDDAAQAEEILNANNDIAANDRIRHQIANNIAQLFAPTVFRGYDSSEDSIDSIDAAGNGGGNRAIEYDAETSGSESSSNSSTSTLSSRSESSVSYGHTSGSEYEYPDVPVRDELHVDTFDWLNTSTVKCKWNVVRDICQRQHGVRFHKMPATVGKYDPIQFQKRAY
uniref:Uncharacterized protein n=1 Tax=Anopheles maculatus TaxID=74869 RepID=A0A182SXK6_9DIPT